MAWYRWAPYVPVAERRRQAKKRMESLRKRGVDIQPVQIEGRTIARTFWGRAWCDHLESFSDYENRLPRGRTYVRNGSVCHLAVGKGKVEAKVSGSEIYNLDIQIKTLPKKKWEAVKQRCAGQIGSLLELLQGTLSDHVMEVVTDRSSGLFPLPGEISFSCDCPDWAVMCKHVAAVLYGVGARLDERPELLFHLRGVDHEELIDSDAEAAVSGATRSGKSKTLAGEDLSDVFGIDIDAGSPADSPPANPGKKAKKKGRAARAAKEEAANNGATGKPARRPARKQSAKKRTGKRQPAAQASRKRPAGKAAKQTATRRRAAKKATRKAK